MMCVVVLRLCSTIQYRGELKLTAYIILCSALLAASGILACLSWMYLINYFRPGEAEMIAFLMLWSLQAHLYFQLVVTRVLVLNRHKATKFRLFIFALNAGINLMMFSLWLAPVIQPFTTHSARIFWLPRVEKCLLLAIDLAINVYFLRLVSSKLLAGGFAKYRTFVHYNYKIIILSLACDCFMLGFQWYPGNDVMFVILHPALFLNKLVLEMSICERMAQSSKSTQGATLQERTMSPSAQLSWRSKAVTNSSRPAGNVDAIVITTTTSSISDVRKTFTGKGLPIPPSFDE